MKQYIPVELNNMEIVEYLNSKSDSWVNQKFEYYPNTVCIYYLKEPKIECNELLKITYENKDPENRKVYILEDN